jgi:hypothetical protein
MGKSNKSSQIKRNKKNKKTVKNKRGGNNSLYGVAQMAQSRGCTRFQGVRNTDPNSSFDTCECIDRNNTKIDQFQFPKGIFTCSPTEGLKMVESIANPLYRTYKSVKDKVFFTKSTDFDLLVEKEFQELLDENTNVAKEAARFLIDYTLDTREHRDRVFYDTLVPENIQTLMNNVQAILENIALVSNNPNLKFNDITSLLGKLVNKLQKQYIQLRELEKTHGKLLEKMELLGKTDREEAIKLIPVNGELTQRRKTNPYNSPVIDNGDYEAQVAKQIALIFGVPDLSLVRNKEMVFVKLAKSKLPTLLKKYYKTNIELMEKIRKERHFISRKIVELLFERDLNIVKNLTIPNITKLMRAYLNYYMRNQMRIDPSVADSAVDLYNTNFLSGYDVKTPEEWIDGSNLLITGHLTETPQLAGKPRMFVLADALSKLLIETLNGV